MLWDNFIRWFDNPWTETTIGAVIALAVMSVASRLIAIVLRRLVRSRAMAAMVLGQAETPLHYLLPLIGLQAVWNDAPPGLRWIALVDHVNSLLVTAVVTWLGMSCIHGIALAVQARHPVNIANNLQARAIATQTRVISRMLMFVVLLIGTAAILMTFPGVRQIGVSLLASAGVAGLVAGIAAKPVLGNLIAGLQIALTQPLRIDDVVVIEGEWGRIEEISGTYVVVAIWDQRRLVVPLQWIIEHPFQNWTRTSAEIIGTVFLWLDYRMPLEPLRKELQRICVGTPLWDKRLCLLQVTDTSEHSMQVRMLVTSQDSSSNWDLRCLVREQLIAFVQREYPQYLPFVRAGITPPLQISASAPT